MSIIIITVLLAFYVAWNLGANDVANSMGTSIGSKAISLKSALIIAGILEFSGAIIFGQSVSSNLATNVANPELFSNNPQLSIVGMISVLIACGICLQLATSKGLPVSSSHAVVGAIAGFSWVAAGINAVDWANISLISLGWLITPAVSGAIAAAFYFILARSILNAPNPLARLQEWIPWLSSLLLTVFGIIVFPTIFDRPFFQSLPFPSHDLSLAVGVVAAICLTFASWKRLGAIQNKKNFDREPNPDRNTLEAVMARFQLVSACFVAFAHGSNDVGNAIAPLATIVHTVRTNTVPIGNIAIPVWILVVGGIGIVAGLAVQGKNVIATIGENIIPLQPSSGFCAEIATATTVLLASRLGLPVSTSHALVGAVVGIGFSQNWRKVRLGTLRSVFIAWLLTVPLAVVISMVIFKILAAIVLR
jgi:inorganic phosphate transporter, PiT family